MIGVLVDTCIWSLALRGKSPRDNAVADELASLIYTEKAKIIGPIRQEVLSGYSDNQQFVQLKDKLTYFPNTTMLDEDFIRAAEFSNHCRKKGIQGSHIDFLICAVARRLKWSIYTFDKDFNHYAEQLPINLHVQSPE